MARIKNIPQVIFLQEGVEEAPEFEEDIDFYDLQEISWSTDKIHSNDLVYYHEDTVNELVKALENAVFEAEHGFKPDLDEMSDAIKKAKGGEV